MMTHHYDYDFLVIGAGSGGVRAARIAATHGAKVAIVEKAALGGTCVNVGCVPKKLFTYAADAHAHLDDAKGYGWTIPTAQFDWPTLLKNKNAEIARLNGIYAQLLDKAGVHLIRGAAQFSGPNAVTVHGETITAERILIAVGGTPRQGRFEGAQHCITSDDAFYLDALPPRIAIIGGGYIAVEFAHIFSGLGVETHLIYRGDTILKNFDQDISTFLTTEMQKQGVQIHLNTDIASVDQGDALSLNLTNGACLQVDHCMLAIGRVAVTEALNLDAAGVETLNNGNIPVNDDYQTNQKHIYAIGDITPRMADLTPVAIAEGHYLADTLFGKGVERAAPDLSTLPTAVFSSPPIGVVGLTEAQARDQGHHIDIYKTDFKALKHSLSGRDERTMMKLVVDQESDKILGLHMCGADTPEMLQGFAIAIAMGATKSDFDRTIPIHPTSAEEFVTLRTPV